MRWTRGLREPIGLHAEHFDYLTAAGDQFGQALAVGVSQRAWFGTNAFGKQRDDLGVEYIGLGKPPRGAGKVTDLAWVDDGKRQSGAGQSRRDGDFKAAGGLHHDQGWSQCTEVVNQLLEPPIMTRDGEVFSPRL